VHRPLGKKRKYGGPYVAAPGAWPAATAASAAAPDRATALEFLAVMRSAMS